MRIYQNIPLSVGHVIALDREASHHAVNVMRLEVGAPVTVFNGRGGEFNASVVSIKKNYMQVRIDKFQNVDRESSLKLHLVQGVSRGSKMDFAIQKAVELGVTHVTPIITDHCVVQMSTERWQKRLLHWKNIIIGACEQSGRNIIPQLDDTICFKKWRENLKESSGKKISDEIRLVLHPARDDASVTHMRRSKSIMLLIGPEGGFSDDEIKTAKQAGFCCVKLGQRIMRTETAALAAVSVLQTKFGDFSFL